nr:IucA/IucC family siderophore biosynthesis protein [Streptomyces corallincola]
MMAAELAAVRPGLLPRWRAELPGARAAVLTRLWRALAHEPLPWITARTRGTYALALRLADGRTLHGPHADPYATAAYVTSVRLDRERYEDAARLMTELGVPHAAGFSAELADSAASLALSRAGAGGASGVGGVTRGASPGVTGDVSPGVTGGVSPGVTGGASGDASGADKWPDRDWEWEQRVVDGHPYHPNCRSRPGFSVADQLAYGPEHRPVVGLGLVEVAESACLMSGSWPDELRSSERLLVPVHPWQADHVLGRRAVPWRAAHPLMSLRTLALPGGPHVKTALSARLTSSVRDISPYSVRASAVLSDFAAELADRTGGLLHTTRTTGAVCDHSADLAALLRESPEEYTGPGERVLPVAALSGTALSQSPYWMAEFTRLALTVGLGLLDLGVALEAHGQNLLVVLGPDNSPLRLVYRDLADIRISPARLAGHGITPPPLTGRLITDDEPALRAKLFGSLIGGALAATAGSGAALGTALKAALPALPDTADLDALCRGPLPVKALTLMRLSPDTPGDQWATLPNPLVLEPGACDQ